MRPGLSQNAIKQGGWASHREVGSLTDRPGLLQGGRASQSEAWPLTVRLGLSQNFLNLPKNLIKAFFHNFLNVSVMRNLHFWNFATKQHQMSPCGPHKILSASERRSRVPTLSDSLSSIRQSQKQQYFLV